MRLSFLANTIVEKCGDFAGSVYGFDFIAIKTLSELQVEEYGQFDVIGQVAACDELDNYNNNDKAGKKKPFTLIDVEKRNDGGLEQVLEKGPWMIRNQPLILTKWAPNLELAKDTVKKVPVWVKVHKVPVVAYSKDSAMCNEPWGRIGYARALIEVSAEKELKKETPPRCMDCQVFRHVASECPKRVIEPVEEVQEVQPDGFTTVKNMKKKGKKVDVDKNHHIVGLKLNKPGPKYAWNVKSNSSASKDTTKKMMLIRLSLRIILVHYKMKIIFYPKDGEGTSSKQNDLTIQASQDSESEVEELESGFDTKTDNHKGQTLPQMRVTCGYFCLIHCMPKVFRIWDWTSNASLCNKGCRNNPIKRRLLWAELGLHKNVVQGAPWILMGDFNVALNMEDNFSGSSSMDSAMNGVLKKLDRIMGNIDFVDAFPGAYAVFQPYRNSDHSPSVLKIPSLTTAKPKPFKFFNFLAYKEGFTELVSNQWAATVEGHMMYQVVKKMKALKKPLHKLMHEQGNLHDHVNRLRDELDEAQKGLDLDPANNELRDEVAVYVQAFNDAKIDEERFLKQKAKIEWLDVGDSNSAYFHKSIKSRNQRSRIEVITNSDNVQVTGNQIQNVYVSHYNAFLGTQATCDELDSEDLFHKKVSDLANENMTKPITNEEIKMAMFGIGDDKALGPDGFTSTFFKKGWDVVGQDICKAVRDFLIMGNFLKNKILTNRIIEGIKEVVSDNQSAFVPGRCISDNILITQELMHNYHCDRGPPRYAFKVDIQKAYDTVDWCFLERILTCFGFHPNMIKWIMACVTSTSFSISINGDVHGFIKGKRGLRQGDPISPYLFSLVMEILTLILKKRVRLSDYFRIHKNCEELNIINVCFADELFLFARGDVNSAKVIMDSLDEFKAVSGLVPSIPKSTAYFVMF
ncbi:aspartic peptidase [Tanacetum coccineum]